MKFWLRLMKRIGITVGAFAIVIGCNTNVIPNDGTTTLDANGFTDASPGGTGATGTPPAEVVVDDVVLPAEETRSFFTAFQVDPTAEDTAGPKFVVAGDVDQDGLMDLVTAWNQSQPIQLHLQRRDANDVISFRTVTLGGTSPIAVVSGLELGQINDDGFLDVVALIKATGGSGQCPSIAGTSSEVSLLEGEIIILFNPGAAATIPDGDRWTEMRLVNPFLTDLTLNSTVGAINHNQFPGNESVDFEILKTEPENAGFTALAVGDIDGVAGDDIIVALNPAECSKYCHLPPVNTVDLWVNPGPGLAENPNNWGAPPVGAQATGIPVSIYSNLPEIKDIALTDIDGDSDNDVVVTVTNALSANVTWLRNPLVPHATGGPSGATQVISGALEPPCGVCDGGDRDGDPCGSDADCVGAVSGTCEVVFSAFRTDSWQERPVGQVDTGADIITIGDVDSDGADDVIVRSTLGEIVLWFRKPNSITIEPEFPPSDTTPDRFNFPWQVFTLTEFNGQTPEAISIGDVTNDLQNEVMIAVEGGVFWYDGTINDSVYEPWVANTIIQDVGSDPADNTVVGGVTPGAGVGVNNVDTNTNINALLIVDLDGDGRNDIIGTLDRRSGSGLSDDRLVWYRNTREE